ncbi:MAG: CPBP family intramembrane metalloprotease [Clostridia bacterium]|nr:CPBP family intramembrane metalloprotease [Clostridia bacterium]
MENGSAILNNLCTCADIILYSAIFLLPTFFIFKYTEKTESYISFKFVFPKNFILLAVTAIGCISASGNITNVIKLLFNKIGIGFISYSPDIPHDLLGIALLFLSSALIPAIVEEILFRKVILNRLIPFGKPFAVILTALLFSLMHTNISQFLYTFTGGLFLGVITVKSVSVIPAIVLHFLNNCLSMVYLLISEFANGKADTAILTFDVMLGIFGIASLYFIIQKNKATLVKNISDSFSAHRFFNVFLIGYVIYCLYLSARWIYII